VTTAFRIGPDSEIVVGRSILDAVLPPRQSRSRVVVLTQPGPARSVAEQVASLMESVTVIEVPDREEAKELDVAGSLYDAFFDLNLGRHDTVVGVGGGAVTDVAGFVAATWLRGIESVLVPTTLLAAVDAAIGGKTGINRHGKNLVGAFWHPTRVLVDLEILERLPAGLKREGSAEILKAGYLADPAIVDEYRRLGPAARLEDVVPRAIAVKAAVVSGDFRESGDRVLLNLGHTIGHAVEVLSPMAHGPAVAVGMVAAARISAERFGFDEHDLVTVLEGSGLPVRATGLDHQACRRLMARDKKRTGEALRMVLLEDIGRPVVDEVSEAEIEMALSAVGIESAPEGSPDIG
jgi:3-dehydroquinate synthase